MYSKSAILIFLAGNLLFSGCGPKWTEAEKEGIMIVSNPGGKTLGYSPLSGLNIITEDRLAFKDLNRNDELDKYEDWRLPVEKRAADLASKMSLDEIAGLMLYSSHQRIPGGGFRDGGTYDGKPFEEGDSKAYDLTDQQVDFLTNDNVRHVLITSVESPVTAAIWNNNAQELVEGIGLGIPANNSSDPRHEANSDEEYTLGAGGDISRWPGPIGLAATFDPELVKEFGRIASIEYRALGLATALSPQIDLATDPRWYRFSGTFGPSPQLSTDLAKAYIDGFQTSHGDQVLFEGWGYQSVNTMAKHWPGGGTGEGGRDAHYGFGKFAVYPGDNFETHLKPFLEGALALDDATGMASAIMPYYTISYDQDPMGENVGNAFSRHFITDQLRNTYGYDGVVCTDWGVTREDEGMAAFGRAPWGVEHLTEAEKHYKIMMAGCDQFGGNNDSGPVIEAYQMGVEEYGEDFMRARFEESAVRLLMNIFRVGLFENPYVIPSETESTVGNPDFMTAGYQAQLKSIVLLKNKDQILPLEEGTRIYLPQRYVPESSSFFGAIIPAKWAHPINKEILEDFFEITDDPAEAEVAIVSINSPENGRTAGYQQSDVDQGGTGFVPISLQYGSYTATEARDPSMAGDGREIDVLNRTYKNKTVTARNSTDLDLILETRKKMKDKPVIVILNLSNPTVVEEFERKIDALVISFEVQDQAVLDILSGKAEPSGLLPLQMPKNMITVETQMEDVPFDMEPYIDSEGNTYDFGFGLNWQGVIQDQRTAKYQKHSELVMQR